MVRWAERALSALVAVAGRAWRARLAGAGVGRGTERPGGASRAVAAIRGRAAGIEPCSWRAWGVLCPRRRVVHLPNERDGRRGFQPLKIILLVCGRFSHDEQYGKEQGETHLREGKSAGRCFSMFLVYRSCFQATSSAPRTGFTRSASKLWPGAPARGLLVARRLRPVLARFPRVPLTTHHPDIAPTSPSSRTYVRSACETALFV
jgi:hypothetical protein